MSILMHCTQTLKHVARRLLQRCNYQISPRTRVYAYLGGNRALTQLATGAPFFVNTDDRGIASWIILGGNWENFVDDVLCGLAKPGMAFLDIGANMGYYTVKVGALVGPEGKTFSFEPNPELFSFLQDNVYINGFTSRSRIWPLALGAEPGSAELRFEYQNMGGGTLSKASSNARSTTVEIDALDRLLPPGTRIDLIKIDAEGYEPQILAGAKRLLGENPHASMVLEVSLAHWRQSGDPEQVLKDLIGDDKEVFKINTNGQVVPMGSAAEFLDKITKGFVSYCLISPKRSSVRQELAALICDA
jgi:FkbM family methyltransferase